MPDAPRPASPRPRLDRRKPDVARLAAGLPSFIRRAKRLERSIERLRARALRAHLKLLAPIAREVRRLELLEGGGAADRFSDPAAFAAVAAAAREDPEFETRYLAPLPAGERARRRLVERTARQLIDQLARYAQRWPTQLAAIDLSDVNEQVASYNRWYLVEVEAAGVPIKHVDTSPKQPWDVERLAGQVPALPALELA